MEKEFKKVYILSFEDEDGNHNTICASSSKKITRAADRAEIRERLEEYLGLQEEDDEEVLADFYKMAEDVLDGKTGWWLDYQVEWNELDLIC